MKDKDIFWNEFGLEDYENRLDRLPGKLAELTAGAVREALTKLPESVRRNPFHDKGRCIRKMNHNGEIILYKEHAEQIEVLGAFSERSDWMNARV